MSKRCLLPLLARFEAALIAVPDRDVSSLYIVILQSREKRRAWRLSIADSTACGSSLWWILLLVHKCLAIAGNGVRFVGGLVFWCLTHEMPMIVLRFRASRFQLSVGARSASNRHVRGLVPGQRTNL